MEPATENSIASAPESPPTLTTLDPYATSTPEVPAALTALDPYATGTSEAPPTLDPYVAILELAERELELARDGRIEDLRSLAPQWDALTAELPAVPPPSARGPLERAAALHARTNATLLSLREAMLCDLRTTARASRAAHGYARQTQRRSRRIDQSI
ncbi:MAG TPA: hypothetical protein VGL37_09760 [Solirubrobacteraceae bacterium]|jgi:hypothetical protein